jgi:hypothetical protein
MLHLLPKPQQLVPIVERQVFAEPTQPQQVVTAVA